MKVLLISEDNNNNYTSIDRSFKNAFLELSNVELFSFNVPNISNIQLINRITARLPRVQSFHKRNVNKSLCEEVKTIRPDVIFIIKGASIFPESLETLKHQFSQAIFICFNPDDPFNLASSNSDILQSIKFYDHYFIWTKRLIKPILESGAKQAHYIPFASDTSLIYPNLKDTSLSFDLTFIGNGDSERQRWVDNIVDHLEKRNDIIKFSVFGKNWKKYKSLNLNGMRNGIDYLKCIGESKINVNFLRKQNKGSTNMRTFEIPAAGGFLMHEYSEEAMEIFKPDKEVVYFSSTEELIDKSSFYLKNVKLRKQIISSGYKKATALESTYLDRVRTILKRINN
ncbi:glycosyltransferase [bacterium]|nr:glycosyltransferase [bacterium]